MLVDKFDASSGTNKINELRERLKTRSLPFSAQFSARHQSLVQPLVADAVARLGSQVSSIRTGRQWRPYRFAGYRRWSGWGTGTFCSGGNLPLMKLNQFGVVGMVDQHVLHARLP